MPEFDSDHRRRLRADCANCFGLCCVVPAFTRSADFAIDKPAGQPCVNLRGDFRCGIHDRLAPRGFRGCTVYDCFGAGQRIAQQTFAGRDWRGAPEIADEMFAAFRVMRQLHELLWYLGEALTLPAAGPVHGALRHARDRTERLAGQSPEALLALDVAAHRDEVNTVLLRASELARSGVVPRPAQLRGADLTGRDLRGVDLRAANLRGSRLIGADLRDVDLGLADVTGADLRGADLTGADLTRTLFLTPAQIDSAVGGDLAGSAR